MLHDFDVNAIKHLNYFHDLADEELAQIHAVATLRIYDKKSIVFHEGQQKDTIYFVINGLIKTIKTDEEGHENIVSFLKDGEMFPHVIFFDAQPYPATAEALVDSQVIAIPRETFEQLIVTIPALTKKIVVMMGNKIRDLQETIQQITGQDAQSRCIFFILKLAEQYGVAKGSGIVIPIPITNLEMANSIGTTRETVNRLLNQLRKQKVIGKDGKKLIIYNQQALEKWITVDREVAVKKG